MKLYIVCSGPGLITISPGSSVAIPKLKFKPQCLSYSQQDVEV